MQGKIIEASVGALFLGLGLWIAVEAEGHAPSWLLALLIGGLGVDAIVSVLRGRRSLLSRIGPLP